ncbi:MAG: serine hydrolase domain-containing protein [Faecousia sp.]
MTEEMKKRIDQVYERWTRGICPGAQVLIRVKGEVVYDRCFGYADIENPRPITDETVFHVASVSKQFTVMGAMLLREEGKLDIDADVRNYIPEYIGFEEPLTVRDLMNNDTGIRDILELADRSGVVNDDALDEDHALRLIARQKNLNFPPRTRHLYSNSNFILLASIVETISGMTLREFLDKRIFKPLGMTQTAVRDKYWTCIDHRSASYRDNGYNYYYAPLTYSIYGTTSLHTTAHDLLKWLDNYRTPKICSQETIDIMTKAAVLVDNAPNTYACGLREDYLEGHRYIKHAGEDAGFRTFTFRLIDDDIDIIKLANCDTILSDPSTMEVARILLGLPPSNGPEMPTEENFDEKKAPGFYYGKEGAAAYSIIEHEGGLAVMERWGPTPLMHVRDNLYRAGRLDVWYLLGERDARYINAEETILLKKAEETPVDARLGQAAAGRYFSSELETAYTITWENDRLYLEHIRRGKSLLHPTDDGRFVAEYDRATYVRFIREDDKVTGLTLTGARILELPLKKIEGGII